MATQPTPTAGGLPIGALCGCAAVERMRQAAWQWGPAPHHIEPPTTNGRVAFATELLLSHLFRGAQQKT